MPPPKLVIFDCDGVLVDTEGPVMSVMQANLSEHGLHLSLEECTSLFVGGTISGVASNIRSMGVPLPDNWTEEAYDAMFTRLRKGVEVISGILPLLDALDGQAIPYCVASNGPMAKMEITLKPSGLWHRLEDQIFSAHTIGLEYAKPSPGLFLHAADAMGIEPQRAVVVEDSVSGVKAAVSAGMQCFGYCAETSRKQLQTAGATPFESMPELLALMDIES